MTDYSGTQFGEYRLLHPLGEGTFGTVYLGEHVYLGTQAAVKVLHTSLPEADWQVFLEEARQIAALQHPHIIRLLSFALHERTPYLVMQLAPRTLKDRFPRGQPQPLAVILSYTRQAAAGIQYAHDHQLLHLDIKPANLLLSERDEVVLADFGIARVLHTQLTHVSVQGFAGTPIYAAPEQFQGKPTRASDQYALAVVVYEWLTGTWPFHGDWFALGHQKLTQEPPSLRGHVSTIPPAVEQVVLKALARDPKDRFESVRAFAEALEQAPEERKVVSVGTRPIPAGARPTGMAAESSRSPKEWLDVGSVHSRAKRYQEALAAYEQALKLDPLLAPAHHARADALSYLKRYEVALAAYDRAIQLDPWLTIFVETTKGNVLFHLKRYEEALAACDRALQRASSVEAQSTFTHTQFYTFWGADLQSVPSAEAHNNRGNALSGLQRYEEALAAYDRALQLHPSDALILTNKAYTLYRLRRYKETLAVCDRALQLDSSLALASCTRALAFDGLKRQKEVLAAYERALEHGATLEHIAINKGAAASDLAEFYQALAYAQEEAVRLNQNAIGPEHLLLGLLRQDEGVPVRVLRTLGVELNKVWSAVELVTPRGAQPVRGKIRFGPRAKQVIELSIDEAHRLNHPSPGTAHLLLGVVREGGNIASGVLESQGVTPEQVRAQTLQVLSHSDPPPAASTQRSGQLDRDHFDKFTQRARNVLSLADTEARRFNHNYIGTEHLLLGLVREGELNQEGEGVAITVLRRLGVEPQKVRSAIEFIIDRHIGRGEQIVLGEIGWTPRARKILERAVEEARQLNHDSIGAEHLLLGMGRDDGIAGGILESLGVKLEEARAQTIQIRESRKGQG